LVQCVFLVTPTHPNRQRELNEGPHFNETFKEGPCADANTRQTVGCNRLQPCRGKASALGAVGIASELTGCDVPPEIGRNGCRGSRKDAARRIRWRIQVGLQGFLWHRQFGKFFAQDQKFLDDAPTDVPWKNFVTRLADLRCEDTHPNLSCFFLRTPECEELMQVAGALRHLARDRAMWSDQVSLNVLQNAFIGR